MKQLLEFPYNSTRTWPTIAVSVNIKVKHSTIVTDGRKRATSREKIHLLIKLNYSKQSIFRNNKKSYRNFTGNDTCSAILAQRPVTS